MAFVSLFFPTASFSFLHIVCQFICLYICIYLSSSSSVFHGVGPLVDPFWSHASRSLFNRLPWFLLPVGEYCFITFGNLLRGILFTCCIQFLLYSCSLSRIGVIFNSFAISLFVLWSVQVYPAVLLMCFISAVILLASLALMVQDSLPYNKTLFIYVFICQACNDAFCTSFEVSVAALVRILLFFWV